MAPDSFTDTPSAHGAEGVRGERRLRDEIVDLAAQVDEMAAGIHKRLADGLDGCSLRELSTLLQGVHRARSTMEAALAGVVAHSDREGQVGLDGHRCARSWVAAICHTSAEDASRISGLAELFAVIPEAERLVDDGRLGIEQAREIVRLVRNRRIGNDGIVASFGSIVDAAAEVTADQFHEFITDLRNQLDADGAQQRHGVARFHRNAHVSTVGEATYVDAMIPILEGEFVKEVFERFKQAEYLADVAAAQARGGPADDRPVNHGDLERTVSQRAGDAFVAVFRAAANAPLDGKPIEFVVDIVIDQPSFEQQLLDLVDPFHQHRGKLARLLDHLADTTDRRYCDDDQGRVDDAPFAGVGGRRGGGTGDAVDRFAHQSRPLCRAESGTAVPADTAVVALLFGHVRRVVVGADGVIIDAGRRRRCFTGSAKDAAVRQALLDGYSGRCTYPGCRNRHLHTDHAAEWGVGGTTSPWNADRLCSFHNLLKSGRGFTARRTRHGWTFHRPDGTAVTQP